MRMRMAVVLVLVCGFLSQALANDAGCGLGSMVMRDNTKVSQTLAVTTNGTFLTQLFGITSGTSNCSANNFVKKEKEAIYFAESNMTNLKIEMARGQGESLTALAEILGCKGQAAESFGTMTRSKYSNILPASNVTPIQMLENIQGEISKDQGLRQACS